MSEPMDIPINDDGDMLSISTYGDDGIALELSDEDEVLLDKGLLDTDRIPHVVLALIREYMRLEEDNDRLAMAQPAKDALKALVGE